MSTDREVTRIVRSWLEEGATALPDRVLDAVLDQVPATRQRRARWPAWRLPKMRTPIKIVLAAAAVVVLAVVGVNLVPRNGGVGGPPSAVPTPSPTPAPALPIGQIPPGRYRNLFVTYTLPAGWSTPNASSVTIFKDSTTTPPTGMVFDLWGGIDTVYSDPCHWKTTAVKIGPTVDNLVAALVGQQRGSTVTPVDVTIDGFPGKEIDLMVPLDVKASPGVNEDGGSDFITGCDGGVYKSWTDASGGDRYNQGPGQHDLLDILDVNGQTRVINRVFWQANTAADRAELQSIIDSIKITP